MFVFVTGYGLLKFRITKKERFLQNVPTQFKGQVKLPKGTTITNGKKWFDLDYWFTKDQIFNSKKSAISFLEDLL